MSDLSKIVARRLPTAELGTHPEANLLTAFAEKSLSAAERQAMLQHLALCVNCRQVLALSIAEYPAEVAASVPQRSAWLSWPVLRWGAAAACVVIVGAAIGLHYQGSRSSYHASVPVSDVPPAPPQMPQNIPSSASQSSSPSTAPEAAAAHATALASPLQDRALESALAKKSAHRLSEQKAAALAPAATFDERQMQASTETLENTQPIPGRTKDEENLPAAAKAKMSLAETVPSRQMMASAAMIARAASVPANVIPRWTLTSEGMLQRSLDSGKTWETILVASPGSFRALTANGFDIWVGGAKGALYHSIDAGQHWLLVQPAAAGERLTADIIGIEFSDALHGIITTGNSQTWVTADAGLTWQKR